MPNGTASYDRYRAAAQGGLIKGTKYQYLSIYAWMVWSGMYTSGRLPGTSFCVNIPSDASCYWSIAKTGSQLVVCSFRRVQSGRSDSTQLNSVVEILKMFRTPRLTKTERFFVDFSFFSVLRAFRATDSLWTHLRSDSTQLNCQLSWDELSWVESDWSLWIQL